MQTINGEFLKMSKIKLKASPKMHVLS